MKSKAKQKNKNSIIDNNTSTNVNKEEKLITDKVDLMVKNESDNVSINVKRIQDITVVPSTILHINAIDNFVVIARSDNSIEIWESNDWVIITKIFGNKSKS